MNVDEVRFASADGTSLEGELAVAPEARAAAVQFLRKLAREGRRFTNAYAACTVCSPTRASIMTGQYPARLHITDWIAGHKRPFARLSVPDWTMQLSPDIPNVAKAQRAAIST